MNAKWLRILVVFMAVLLTANGLFADAARAEDPEGWYSFLLICNEGNSNEAGNVGNTAMIFTVNPGKGIVKQITLLWDIFVEDDDYETPQLLDQAFRDKGAVKLLEVVNENFQQDIDLYLSLNYLNMALLIDYYGGVVIDLSRPDRNAINGLLDDKVWHMQEELADLGVDASQFEELTHNYFLTDYGAETHLSGFQSVAYGWLQYDSVVNCCMREAEVISQLFFRIVDYVHERAFIYTTDTAEMLEYASENQRVINLDDMSDDDSAYLLSLIHPIMERSFTNMNDDQTIGLLEAVLRADATKRAKGNLTFENIQYMLLPVDSSDAYEREVDGVRGRMIDFEQNIQALNDFMFSDDPMAVIITQ